MKEKFIENKRVILLIASIVAAALLVPTFISFFGNAINDRTVINMIIYLALLAADLVFLFYAFKQKEINSKLLLIPVILITSAGLLENIYAIITNNDWSAIFFAALYAGILVVYIIYMSNNCDKLKIALYILLLICMCFNLTAAFSRSTVEMSKLITNLICITCLYFIPKGGEQQ